MKMGGVPKTMDNDIETLAQYTDPLDSAMDEYKESVENHMTDQYPDGFISEQDEDTVDPEMVKYPKEVIRC